MLVCRTVPGMRGLRLALCLAAGAVAWGQPATVAPQAVINKYCTACHNDALKTAGVSLTAVKTSEVAASAPVFEKVLRKVRTGEMPPFPMPTPDPATRSGFVNWLESQLNQASAAKPNPGAPAIHRLNRAEYSNAIRDLLALDLDHSAGLPQDDSGYGFDNIGDVLTVSPLHMEKSMSSASKVARLALGTGKASPVLDKYPAGRGAVEMPDEMPLGERGGMLLHRYFSHDAEYSFTVRVRGNPPPGTPAAKLDLRMDGDRIKLFDVQVNTEEAAQDTRNYEIKLPVKAGMHWIGAGFLNETVKAEGGPVGGRRGGAAAAPPPVFNAVSVESVSVGGPIGVASVGDSESRRRIYVCHPGSGKTEEVCAKEIFSTLARRAYRRPVTQTDMAPIMKLFASGRTDGGSFDAGVETGLRAILVSPDFLFRVEKDPDKSAPGSVHRVGDLDLASRLSFFLWSSIPDDELLRVAEQNKLHEPAALKAQVLRMLADKKSKALVDNFGGQWLELRNLAGWKPDPEKYPAFDEPLRDAMRRETEMFFEHIVKDDRSVLDFLSADYTFVNERLARHYGIPDVHGNYFRQVQLLNPERGGILTQGSVLTVTSYPTRTSPVLRGKWVLENVLGSPPPPPPPDVPALAESASQSPKSLREQFEKHRANAMCASCHVRLDPMGFSLENYDAIGKYREKEGGVEIDASGKLPNGTTVNGPGDLKKVLLERKDQFVECLAEKLLTYALGRGLEYYDFPAVRQVRADAARDDYKFSAIILAVANSLPFQMRRTPER